MNMKRVLVYGLVGTSSLASGQPSFQTVGYLPGGNTISHARGVSDNGSIVVGYSAAGGVAITGFRWSEAFSLEQVPVIQGTIDYLPYLTSPSGSLISGTHVSDGGTVGFVWSESLGTLSIGELPGGNRNSYLSAITEHGYGVGASATSLTEGGQSYSRAISWTPEGGMQLLPLPSPSDEGSSSSARTMLPDGRIFGRSASGAWLYSEDTGFEMLPGAQHMNFATDDGSMLSGTGGEGANNPSYWTRETGLVELPLLGDDFFGSMLGMSGDGSVMVGVSQGVPVVWIDQGAPVTVAEYAESFGLDMTGWRITSMGNVSADGTTIVGTARHESWASGHLEGFVLTIPAPGTTGILMAAGMAAVRRRRSAV